MKYKSLAVLTVVIGLLCAPAAWGADDQARNAAPAEHGILPIPDNSGDLLHQNYRAQTKCPNP
jgi:hypothetical protein